MVNRYYIAMMLWLVISGSGFAQTTIDPRLFQEFTNKTVRSIYINPEEIRGKTWCSYAIHHELMVFMIGGNRHDPQATWLNTASRKWICMGNSSCNRSWELTEKTLEAALKLTKQDQVENLERDQEEITKQIADTVGRHKLATEIPVNISQLHGTTDLADKMYAVVVEQFEKALVSDCEQNFHDQKLSSIVSDLEEKSSEQDRAYVESNRYALGMHRNLDFHYAQMQQSRFRLLSAESITPDYMVYDIFTGTLKNGQ